MAPTNSGARPRNALALIASFLVYAIPLPGAHAIPLLGTSLAAPFSGASRIHGLAVATAVMALMAQVLSFLVLRWVLAQRPRWLLLILYVPALIFCVNLMALLVLPRWMLIERDSSPEKLSWPVLCTVPDASVLAVNSMPAIPAQSGETWLNLGRDGSRIAIMRGPACAVSQPLSPPARGTMFGIAHTVPGGATLETTWDVATQKQIWWWRRSPEAAAIELESIPGRLDSVPIISDDGGWLVLVERPNPPPAFPHILLRRLPDGHSRKVALDRLERGTLTLRSAALVVDAAGELTSGVVPLCLNDRVFLSVNLEGEIVDAPFNPPGIEAGARSLRLVAGGWVAWDAYTDEHAYQVAWKTRAGTGTHRIPRGRGINSVDVDPNGNWLAISTGPIYSLGGVHDDVIILSLADGSEVFRDALPTYARSNVAFLGPDRMAYTAWDGDRRSEVRVIRAP